MGLMPALPPTFNAAIPGANDLCQVADVTDWLPALGQAGQNAANSPWVANRLPRLIRACSSGILNFLRRDTINPVTITEIRNGSGTASMALRNWPVISVMSVIASNAVIPQSPLNSPLLGVQYGWVCDGYSVGIAGSYGGYPYGSGFGIGAGVYGLLPNIFPRGFQNVQIVYTYGFGNQYAITGVSMAPGTGTTPWPGAVVTLTLSLTTPPSSVNPAFIPQVGQTVLVSGITPAGYNGQVAITAVSGNTISYQISQPAGDPGPYVSGGTVLAGMIPDDIQQACIELVAQKCMRSQHIDEDSLSFGAGQTTSYQKVAIPRETEFALERYRLMPVMEV